MVLIHAASGNQNGGAFGLTGSSFLQLTGIPVRSATTLNDNQYVQRLNDLLQQELAAVNCYARLDQSTLVQQTTLPIDTFHGEHRDASLQVERLVLANRGIPAERAASTASSLSRSMIEFCRALPVSGSRRVMIGQLIHFENQLERRYDRCTNEAPNRDLSVLKLLKTRCQRRAETLRNL